MIPGLTPGKEESVQGLGVIRLHYRTRIDESEDCKNDALRQTKPGRAESGETRFKWCQIAPIGAGIGPIEALPVSGLKAPVIVR